MVQKLDNFNNFAPKFTTNMSQTIQKQVPEQQEQMGLDYREVLFLCLSHWKWFALSIIVALICAVYYSLSTTPTYSSSAVVLMADNSSLASNANLGMDMSMFTGSRNKKNNVYNDMEMFKSPDLMTKVITELDLQMNYSTKGMFRDYICYGSSLPAKVKFLDLDDSESIQFDFNVYRDSTFSISDMAYAGNPLEFETISGHFGDTISCIVGRFVVCPTDYYYVPRKMVFDYFKEQSESKVISYVNSKVDSIRTNADSTSFLKRALGENEANGKFDASKAGMNKGLLKSMHVSRVALQPLAAAYSRSLTVDLSGKLSTTLNLKIVNSSPERTRDMLSMLIAVYNGQWLLSRNQISKSTSDFIDDRLVIIQQELGNVDQDISSFKSENMMPNLEQASSMFMSKSEQINTALEQLNNELYMARYIKTYLTSGAHQDELLPVNTGLQGTSLSAPVTAYNEQLLRRNALLSKSSSKNPLVQTYDRELAEMRSAIISSVDQEIVALNARIKALKGTEEKTTKSIKSSPTQAKHLLSIERQQKVKESLYLYLLQKREENELSQAFTAYNTQVVTPPTLAVKIAPMSYKVLSIGLIIGLLIPLSVIVIGLMTNTTIRGKKDLNVLSIPIIGEVPMYMKNKKDMSLSAWRRLKLLMMRCGVIDFEIQEPVAQDVLVAQGERDILNEAFRVIRTNIEFMTTKNEPAVIQTTSFNPGSGKSFCSMNIAASLAIRGAKTLVIDCDLRHASASNYVPKTEFGVADYLASKVDDINDIIVQHPRFDSLHVMPVGSIPPNPSELLSEPRFEEMIKTLKNYYQYIFLDCPPVDMVADTQIVSKVADRTIFVVRVGLMERAMLPELELLASSKRLNNMTVLLNGSQAAGKYGYRYGYKYGSHYAYGYEKNGNSGAYYFGHKRV